MIRWLTFDPKTKDMEVELRQKPGMVWASRGGEIGVSDI
jgi:hypothetical protein